MALDLFCVFSFFLLDLPWLYLSKLLDRQENKIDLINMKLEAAMRGCVRVWVVKEQGKNVVADKIELTMCLSVCLSIENKINDFVTTLKPQQQQQLISMFGQWIIYRHMANANIKSLKFILVFPARHPYRKFPPSFRRIVRKQIDFNRGHRKTVHSNTHTHAQLIFCDGTWPNACAYFLRPKVYVETKPRHPFSIHMEIRMCDVLSL